MLYKEYIKLNTKQNWDLIGLDINEYFVIVEAKAHIDELTDNGFKAEERSLKVIHHVIDEYLNEMKIQFSDGMLREDYYQLLNRLLTIHILNLL